MVGKAAHFQVIVNKTGMNGVQDGCKNYIIATVGKDIA